MPISPQVQSMNINELIDYIVKGNIRPDDDVAYRLALMLELGGESLVSDQKQLKRALALCRADSVKDLIAQRRNVRYSHPESNYNAGLTSSENISDDKLQKLSNEVTISGGKMNDDLQKRVVDALAPVFGKETVESFVSQALNGTTGPLQEAIRGVAAFGVEMFSSKPYTRKGDLAQEILTRHQYGTTEYRHVEAIRKQQALRGAANIKKLVPSMSDTEAEHLQELLSSKTVKGLLKMGKPAAVGFLSQNGGAEQSTASLLFDRLEKEGDAFLYGNVGDTSKLYYDLIDGSTSPRERELALSTVTRFGGTDVTAETGFMRSTDAQAALKSYRDSGRDIFAGTRLYNQYSLPEFSQEEQNNMRERVHALALQERFNLSKDQIDPITGKPIDSVKFDKKQKRRFENEFNRLYDDVAMIAFGGYDNETAKAKFQQLLDQNPDNKHALYKMLNHIQSEAGSAIVQQRLITEHKGLRLIQEGLEGLAGAEKVFGGAPSPEAAAMTRKLLGGYGTLSNDSVSTAARANRIVRAAKRTGIDAERLFSMGAKAGETLQQLGRNSSMSSLAMDIGMSMYENYKNGVGRSGPFDAEAAQAATMETGAKITADVGSRNLAWLLGIHAAPGSELEALQKRALDGKLTAEDAQVLQSDMTQFAGQMYGATREEFFRTRTDSAIDTYMKNLGDRSEIWKTAAQKMTFNEGIKEYTQRTDQFLDTIASGYLGMFGTDVKSGRESLGQAYQGLISAGGFTKNRMDEIMSGTGDPITDDEWNHLVQQLGKDKANNIRQVNNRARQLQATNAQAGRAYANQIATGSTRNLNDVGETEEQFNTYQNTVAKPSSVLRDQRLETLTQGKIDRNKSGLMSVLDSGKEGGEAIGAALATMFSEQGLGNKEIQARIDDGTVAGVLLADAAKAGNKQDFIEALRVNKEDVNDLVAASGYGSIDELYKAVSATGDDAMSDEELLKLAQRLNKSKYMRRVSKAIFGSDVDYDTNLQVPEDEKNKKVEKPATGEAKKAEDTKTAVPASTKEDKPASKGTEVAEMPRYTTDTNGRLEVVVVNNPLEIEES